MPLLKLNPFMTSSNDSKPNILLPVHPILASPTPTPQQIGNYTLDDLNSTYEKYKRLKHIQWNLDLSFFKGLEKTNDECGKTVNPGNHFFKQKVHCLLLLGGILPQLKI
jgi:hypothetical protein